MATSDDSRMNSRTWSFVLAACWGVLGAWVLSTGQTWLGLAQMALGVAYLARAAPRLDPRR